MHTHLLPRWLRVGRELLQRPFYWDRVQSALTLSLEEQASRPLCCLELVPGIDSRLSHLRAGRADHVAGARGRYICACDGLVSVACCERMGSWFGRSCPLSISGPQRHPASAAPASQPFSPHNTRTHTHTNTHECSVRIGDARPSLRPASASPLTPQEDFLQRLGSRDLAACCEERTAVHLLLRADSVNRARVDWRRLKASGPHE
jgi:hypothetical protein